MLVRFFVTILIVFSFSCLSNAQPNYYKLGFTRNQVIEVKKNNTIFFHPFAGGMNSVYFSQIDLDLDGIPDFIAFEKHGNRILPFINKGTNEIPKFVYAPEYRHHFPDLHDWAILADFNNDGKADIFTYGLGCIRVFQNVSDKELTFQLIADPVKSYHYGDTIPIGIFASPDDYLGIADVTGDGKLDILNFWVLGKHVHLHKNISEEDSHLTYILNDECWGKFSEAADNNKISLLTYCKGKGDLGDRHIGSSIFMIDYNQDGLMDIVIGDVDYPGLILLINGGTPEEALMISQTDDFPNANTPVYLYSMPTVSTMDFWNAERPDLFVSPSDPSLTKSEDLNSVWHYHYDKQFDDYVLVTKSFLQEDMIDVGSGAAPILYDWNDDGLLDLFIANYGNFDSAALHNGILESYYTSSITYYKNVGTKTNPKFEWVTSDFGDLKKYGYVALFPAFADLTGDGKIDLLCGNKDGSLLFFENKGIQGELPQFENPIYNYSNINVGAFSTPQLFDIDKTGELDLLLGSQKGTLSYYQNSGTNQSPNFQLMTHNFGNVDVHDPEISYFGYSIPCFFRYNDETLLLCGNEQGILFLFSNIDNNLAGDFIFEEKIAETIQNKGYKIIEGIRVAAAVADINDDGKPDLFVGNWAGGISFFSGSEPVENCIAEQLQTDVLVYPNPTTGQLRIKNYELRINNVEILDVCGKTVPYKQLSIINYQLSIENLPAGFYLMKITLETGVVYKKIVKM